MKNVFRVCSLFAALFAAGSCGASADGEGLTGPVEEIDGVRYTARVEEILAETTRRFAVFVTLTNTNPESVTKTYPSGCPVRIRLYRQQDNKLQYDETKVACSVTSPASFSLAPGASQSLQSGVRWPPDVLGDTLVAVTYNVRAVVTTEGTRVVEVEAGAYRVPSCVENQAKQTICT